MSSSSFGPQSTNPRQRRAYAHAQLARLREGTGSLEGTRIAIEAASATGKGRASNFIAALVNIGLDKAAGSTHVFVDWSADSPERAVFGGYLMPESEIAIWEARHAEALRIEEDDRGPIPYNGIFTQGYRTVILTASPEYGNAFQWGRGYNLEQNPAHARLKMPELPGVATIEIGPTEPIHIPPAVGSAISTEMPEAYRVPAAPQGGLEFRANISTGQGTSPIKMGDLCGERVYYDSDGTPFYVTGLDDRSIC